MIHLLKMDSKKTKTLVQIDASRLFSQGVSQVLSVNQRRPPTQTAAETVDQMAAPQVLVLIQGATKTKGKTQTQPSRSPATREETEATSKCP